MDWHDRIVVDPKILVGKPVIKGTRIAVEFIVGLLANGWTAEQILHEYDHLTPEDIQACLAASVDARKEHPMHTARLRQFGSVGSTWALVLSATFLSVVSLRAQPPAKHDKKADEMTALLKARVAVAQKGYEETAKRLGEVRRPSTGGNVLVSKPEEVYVWSIRWLQAQNPKDAAPIAALEDHLKRVAELEKKVKLFVPALLPETAALEAEWYWLEAELWLAQAKAKERKE